MSSLRQFGGTFTCRRRESFVELRAQLGQFDLSREDFA